MATTDIGNVQVKLPLVISAISGVLMVVIGYWVHASDAELDRAKMAVVENAKQINSVAQQQAVTQTQISQILEAVREAREDSKETHDAVIRLEAKQK